MQTIFRIACEHNQKLLELTCHLKLKKGYPLHWSAFFFMRFHFSPCLFSLFFQEVRDFMDILHCAAQRLTEKAWTFFCSRARYLVCICGTESLLLYVTHMYTHSTSMQIKLKKKDTLTIIMIATSPSTFLHSWLLFVFIFCFISRVCGHSTRSGTFTVSIFNRYAGSNNQRTFHSFLPCRIGSLFNSACMRHTHSWMLS